MTEDLKKYIRINRTAQCTFIEVTTVGWEGPWAETIQWEIAKRLEQNPSSTELMEAINQLLEDRRYFRTCLECNKTKLAGYMHDETVCQACAPEKYGVVY